MSKDKFKQQLNFVINNIISGIQIGLYESGKDIINERIKNSKETKTGREYIIYVNGRRKRHRASAPYQPLEGSATLTGAKNKNTKHFVKGTTLNIGVNKNIKYARKIEETRGDLQKATKKNIENNNIKNNIIKGIIHRFKK